MDHYMQTVIAKAQEGAAKYLSEELDVLQEICNTDCQSRDVEGNRKVISILQRRVFPHLPAALEYVEAPGVGTHVVARIKPEHPRGKIVMVAHLDTVFPAGSATAHPFHIDGEWAYGLGVADCKGGIITGSYALRILAESQLLPDWEIVMVWNCDEEIGSPTSRPLFEREAQGADYTFAMESARLENGLLTCRWGCALFTVKVTGRTAHAGLAYPQGADANLQLARIITRLAEKNDPTRNLYFNCGHISGGEHGDIVSEAAQAEGVFIFSSPEEFEKIQAIIKSVETDGLLPGCTVHTDISLMFPAMPRSDKTLKVYHLVHEAGQLLGRDYPEQSSLGSSDANWLTHFGAPSLCALGPYMRDIHTVKERLKIESLVEKTALFAVTVGLLREREGA